MRITSPTFAARSFGHYFWVFFILALSWPMSMPETAMASPTVTASSPATGAIEVPTAAAVTATFSEPLEPATITTGSITLSQPVRIKAIAAGFNYTLALRDNGTVAGWGFNANGETTVPPGLSGVTAIATSSNHSLALKSDGTVVAWGDQATVPAGLSEVTAIAAGGNFNLALKADQTLVAWGNNAYGQSTVPGGLVGVTGIAAGFAHALALKADGTVVAWGYNSSGQATVPPGLSGVIAIATGLNNSVALKADGTVVAWGANNSGQSTVPANLSGVIAIAAGLDHTIALKTDGSVIAWGDNTYGQTNSPAGLPPIAAIAAGYYHSVALKKDGSVISWGDNSYSQTMLPTGLTGVTAAAAGSGHTVALKSDGTLFAWGYNSNGQADTPMGISGISAIAAGYAHTLSLSASGVVTAWGRNDAGQTTVPTELVGAIAIAAGDSHSVAIKDDGTVVAWGLNSAGQTTVPAGLAGVTKIAAGSAYTLALKQDGTVTAWGNNYAGSTPLGLSGVIAITAGGYHSLALKNDGTVTGWGDNAQGQSTVPAGLTNVIAIAAGKSHSVALKSDGTVVAWGANAFGQTAVPAGLSDVVGIAAGNNYTIAVKNDGTLVGWGHNSYNQATAPQDPYALPITTAVSYNTGSNSVTLNPYSLLPLATTLTATVNTGVRSLEGNHPTADYSWSFTTIDPTPPFTIASPSGGTYSMPQYVILTANEPATIYYTNNGADPTIDSPVYSGPIPIAANTTLKFFARDSAGNSEPVRTETYIINFDTTPPVTTPSPAGGTYSSARSVTLTANEPATIYYTTNGTAPTLASPVYSGPITVSVSRSLKFFARDSAGNSEAVKTATYIINLDTTPPVTTPSPAGGTYSSAQNVTLTANEPATIYYTTNGTAPTIASPVYSGPITVSVSRSLKFFARDSAGNSEAVKTATYIINLDTTPPVTTPSPAGGTYTSVKSVTLTANEPATIYYTTNGTAPTTTSPAYSGPLTIGVTTSLKFFARDSAGNSEAVKTANYIINLDTTPPVTTPSPAGGTYSSAQNVTLTANEPATIYYTTNGSTPSTSSPTYSGPLPIPATTTLKFFARDTAGNSEIAKTASYIIKQNQTITFGPLPAKTYGDPAFTLSASTSSGLPVSYTSSNTSVATISGITVTIVGAGSATITASQSGNAAYNPAVAVAQTLIVTKAILMVQAANATRAYGADDPIFSATYSGFVNGDTQSVLAGSPGLSAAATITSPVGTYPITAAAGTLAAANYSFTYSNGTLTIIKATATVTLGNLSTTYDGTPKSATATTIPAGINVSLTYNGEVTPPTAVGSYTVVGTVSDPNYQGNATGNLTIAKGEQTITFSALPSKTYGDEPFTLASSASSGLAVTYTSSNTALATINGSTVTIVGAGTAVITARQDGDANYNAAPAANQSLTINKAPATIVFGELNFTYDGTPKPVMVTTIPAGLAVTITYNGSTTAPTTVGSYTVVATVNDANYQGSATATEEIAKRNQIITFDPLPAKTYGDASFTLTADASSNLAVTFTSSNLDVATITGKGKTSTVTIVGAGTTIITAYQEGNGNYNNAPPVPQTLVVDKAAGTVNLGSLSATYDGTAKTATATTNPSGLAVTFSYNGSAIAPSAAGNYTVIGTITDSNYQGSASGSLVIAKASQAVTFAALPAMTYGTAPFNPNATASSGLVTSYTSSNPAVATISGTIVTIVGVGTTTITASQVGDGNYSAASPVPQTLTVSKGTATVTITGLNTTYNGTPRPATATTIPNGLPVTLTYDGSATVPTAIGTYSVTATVTSPNYQGSATATLTIAKGIQTITFGTLPAKTIGNAPFTLTATSTSGLAVSYTSSNPAVATVSGTTVTIVGAGTTTIIASQGGDANYDAANPVSQALTVNSGTAGTGKTAVTIGSTTSYFDTLTAALASIPAGSTSTIKLQTMTFAEVVNLNTIGATITFLGGYDSVFNSAVGMSTIQGNLTIRAGTLIANKLVII